MKEQINYGIQLLRMILCFWVVCFHCLKVENKILRNIIFVKLYHVPTFVFISFYFLLNNLYTRDIRKIKHRFIRLLIPYFAWPLIIWIINNILYLLSNYNRFNRYLSLYELYIQLLIGRSFHPVFWFQFNLIILTILYFIIAFIFKKNFLFIFIMIGMLSYILQYSNYNYNLFKNYKRNIILSIGYICEILPLTVSGILFASFKVIEKLEIHRKKSILISIIVLYCLFKYNIFYDLKGFGYNGIIINFGSIFLFISFSLISIDRIKNKNIILIVNYVTSYTLGIYSLHQIVRDYLKLKFSYVKKKTIYGCLLIYLFSYFISFFGNKIFKKGKYKYLFN